MYKPTFLLNILGTCIIKYIFAEEYDSDDKLYMFVSPDQHEKTPRLEDFFWTGSGDGPPAPPDLPLPTPSQPATPLIRTTTVLATVYLDSFPPQAVTDKTTGECVLNCGDAVPDSLEPEIPEDRRYWLLTVIQGSTPDSLQLKLARLYQKAFLRQQERHLGIIKSLDAPTGRKKHDVHSFVVNKDNNNNQVNSISSETPFKYYDIHGTVVSVESISSIASESLVMPSSDIVSSSSSMLPLNIENVEIFSSNNVHNASSRSEIRATTINEVESWILVNPTNVVRKREVSDREEMEYDKEEMIDIPLEADYGNGTALFKREIIKPEQQPPVQVHIQNITESAESGSVQIIYVVLVGGRAVPAAVAARDMRLVRDAEVAHELGAVVTTKAEPYLKAAEGLEGEASTGGVHGTELWALAIGATIAVLLLLVIIVLLCFAHRKKSMKSAASLRAYRNELLREAERNQLKQVHEEKDGRLISVVSPSRTRPSSSTLLPIYRAASASSTSSSGVSEMAAALRRRQKKPHALRMPQKKRVGTTDSLLEAAGVDSSDSGQPSVPHTPTSYLSMPSVNSFPRGNIVEPLSRILEPVSVRHLDIDSPVTSPKSKEKGQDKSKDVVPRRQMPSQLVRLGSIDKDPGVIGPLVWDLHCQRIKDASKPSSPARSVAGVSHEDSSRRAGAGRMRRRFNELMDDAFTLFGSAASSPKSHHTFTVDPERDRDKKPERGPSGVEDRSPIAQARNEMVRLPGSPYSALATLRGRSADTHMRDTGTGTAGPSESRPRTSQTRPATERKAPPPARAWGPTPPHSLTSRLPPAPIVNTALIRAEGHLPAEDPALPLISAIKDEIQRIRDQAKPT
ncbi:uncharacterized protein LOC116412954 isoform X2 [Galleria mellonella]|uniref:Uncharacterized protein LOC116412954 isoform X2 n=1 Tax=Galleria mellonella TaxID=7137 RepID=A0ABM3MES1_GALME|nr:uncharacterized protein LOC116412954 isoform X2 [Galleria mellonella]